MSRELNLVEFLKAVVLRQLKDTEDEKFSKKTKPFVHLLSPINVMLTLYLHC